MENANLDFDISKYPEGLEFIKTHLMEGFPEPARDGLLIGLISFLVMN